MDVKIVFRVRLDVRFVRFLVGLNLSTPSFDVFFRHSTMADFAENGVVLKGATRSLRSAPLARSFAPLRSAPLRSAPLTRSVADATLARSLRSAHSLARFAPLCSLVRSRVGRSDTIVQRLFLFNIRTIVSNSSFSVAFFIFPAHSSFFILLQRPLHHGIRRSHE